MRTCSRCQKTMVPQTQEEITLDACPKCERVFLDCGELVVLSKQHPDIEEKLRGSIGQHSAGDRCPDCGHQMIEARIEYMMMERCENCCGVFVSKSTLESAIKSHPIVDYTEPKKTKGFF